MVKVSLMSDPSAIITQVNPNEQVIPAESKNHSQTDNTDFVSGTDGAAGVNGQKKDKDSAGGSAGGGSRHSGGGGCFRSLFCCLKIRSKKPKPEHNNPPVAPLANTTAAEQPATNRGHSLLPCKNPLDRNKKCVVIDLDETLVHSSFKPIDNADFVVPIEIDLTVHQVYVLKRPHVDEFLRRMGELFECVLFTASLAKYADPVADLLDKWEVFRARLFRDSCVYHRGNYVKDLGRLGRELKDVIIIDNSPASYIFHPENAIPVNSWFDDMDDRELLELIPTMEKIASTNDIYPVVKECALSKQRPPLSSVSIMPPAQEIGAYTITSPPPPQPPSYATVSAIRTSNNSDSGDVSSVSSGSYTVVASTSASSATFVGPNTRLSGATNATSNNPQPSESINVNVDNPNSSSVSNIQPQQTTAYQGSEPPRENNTTTTTTTTTIFSTASETGFDETNKGQVSLLAGDNEVKRSASELVTVSNSSQVELNAADNSAGSKGSISASVAATTNSTQA